jgi:hypothetical protein
MVHWPWPLRFPSDQASFFAPKPCASRFDVLPPLLA